MKPKKPSKVNPADPRNPYRAVRVRGVLADVADSRAAALAQDFTQYVNDAIRMRLEAEGVWPPKSAKP